MLVCDYYATESLYYFLDHPSDLKWKNSKLKSCRSHRAQFSYKNHLHPTSFEKDMIFYKVKSYHVTPARATKVYYRANESGVTRSFT